MDLREIFRKSTAVIIINAGRRTEQRLQHRTETKPLILPLTASHSQNVLQIVAVKLWHTLLAELWWGFRESHKMTVMWNYPSSIADSLSFEEQLQHPCIRYNPCYWLLMLVTTPCVCWGRWIHALLGQGGPVRDDESEIEREARIQWIYTTGVSPTPTCVHFFHQTDLLVHQTAPLLSPRSCRLCI